MLLLWGDLHNHCGISYGFGSLDNALENARTHLDFCGITGHAMWPDMMERTPETAFVVDFHKKGFAKLKKHWPQVQQRINQANSQELVTFQTYEMHSSCYGDRHFVSPDDSFPLIYRDSPEELLRDCGCRAIAVPHHIGYAPGYRGIDWSLFDAAPSPIVEVVSKHGAAMRDDAAYPYYHDMGPMDARNTVAAGLEGGRRFSFVGSTDHHAGFPGSWGDGLMAVYAEEKSRESIWKAIMRGHCYAITGDRIACMLRVNDAMLGDEIVAGRRHVVLKAQGDAPIELATLRRNGQIIAADVPRCNLGMAAEDTYLLRVEMGWSSSPEKYHWEGRLQVDGGSVVAVRPYLRGLNALSPSDSDADKLDETNRMDNGWSMEPDGAHFRCDTVCNKSTLHPQTSAFLFEVKAGRDALVSLQINGKHYSTPLKELLHAGYADHMLPWHSHAFKMHTAYPKRACRALIELDDVRHSPWDYYQAEVVQANGSRAYVSPVFVR